MPFSLISPSRSSVKCKPAVGAAAEPRSLEYTVWYLSWSSSFALIYGGKGILPNFSSISSNTPSYLNSTILVPSSATSTTSALSSPLPNSKTLPGLALLPGFTSVCHLLMSSLLSKRNSTSAPVVFLPKIRAGMTLVLLSTRQSPGFRSPTTSLNLPCPISPVFLLSIINLDSSLLLRGSWAMYDSGNS